MAAELKREYSVDTRLIEGSRGIFDVRVDGQVVYSKHQTQRFPQDGEVVRIIGPR